MFVLSFSIFFILFLFLKNIISKNTNNKVDTRLVAAFPIRNDTKNNVNKGNIIILL